MKTFNIQTPIKRIVLYALVISWIAMLSAIWDTWQSTVHAPNTNFSSARLHDLDSQSYWSYLDMHQRFSPNNKALIKTIHVCRQSSSQPTTSQDRLGCTKQLKSRFL